MPELPCRQCESLDGELTRSSERAAVLASMLAQVVGHHDQLLASIDEPDSVYAVALTRLHASLEGARALLGWDKRVGS